MAILGPVWRRTGRPPLSSAATAVRINQQSWPWVGGDGASEIIMKLGHKMATSLLLKLFKLFFQMWVQNFADLR
jgi:hypothetical protein